MTWVLTFIYRSLCIVPGLFHQVVAEEHLQGLAHKWVALGGNIVGSIVISPQGGMGPVKIAGGVYPPPHGRAFN